MDLDGTLSDLTAPKFTAEDFRRIFPSWTLYAAIGVGLGCVVLITLYYLEHPGRSIIEDFQSGAGTRLGLVGGAGDPTPDPGMETGSDGQAVA